VIEETKEGEMKRMARVFAVLLMLGAPAAAQNAARASFEKLKSLTGEWEGRTSSGKAAKVSYRVTSGGSVVMETLRQEGEQEMVTMYHFDGNSLMMTHYCAAGNQPRMRATSASADGKQISFAFQDATNLPSPDAGHMRGMTFTWRDADHITQVWTWHEKGKPDMPETFEFTRKK
jgi:hypothetical protein